MALDLPALFLHGTQSLAASDMMTPFCAASKILRRSVYKRSPQDSLADLIPLTTTKARLSASLSANALRKAVSPSLRINAWPMTPKLKSAAAAGALRQAPPLSAINSVSAAGNSVRSRGLPGFRRRMFIPSFLLAGAELFQLIQRIECLARRQQIGIDAVQRLQQAQR